MMLPIDQTDHAEARRPDSTEPFRPGGILLLGYLRKLKRMKKKYFILFADSESLPARLEYFDSEKKWKNGQTAKRSIEIKSCFNINRRMDCKHKFVIGLYTNEDCFPIAFETEEELIKWFITLLKIQLVDKVAEGEELKPIYEHVWQVNVQRKELGSRKNIVGPYRLCLNTTTRVLTLFKMPLAPTTAELFEFPVKTIRRCGHVNCQFFMEMGRGTVTGDGELWMDLEEASVAQKVHGAVIEAMRNSAKEDIAPRPRNRSFSANDRQQQQQPNCWEPSRNRTESVPSRSRTTSENVVVTPPMEGSSTSPPTIPSSFSMDDFDTVHPVHIRSRLTATPENSLPKDQTILEEQDRYLLMSHLSSSPYSSRSQSSIRGGYKRPPIKPPLHPPQYMEMASPPNGYLPMYPSAPGSVGTRSGTHTRSSSFCEDPPPPLDSYVPMAPQSVASSVTSESYMDMRRSVPRDVHIRGRLSPASGSSLASSFTSGTPPVSRFQEYHLEKVASFLTPSEDDDSLSSLSCRQSRAYSVGSRPDRNRKIVDPVPAAAYQSADARVRAYSVGSRVAGSGSSSNELMMEQQPTNNPINPSPSTEQQQPDERKKSLSVPYLGTSGSINPTGTFFRTLLNQQTAVKRENDLMEIEFARLNFSSDSLGVDQVDLGSTDSVGRSSNSSGGRPRSASNQSRPSFGSNRSIVVGKPKLGSREGRVGRLERLESVPQGRDQDYIEYGERLVSSPVAKMDNNDSADEYVELAQPSKSVRLSVSESGSGIISPGSSDYMVMSSSNRNSRSSLNTVLCQIAREPSNYIDMNYNNKDEFGYLPMDYTPRSSRNPSRQSSQVDLMALGSPSMRGSQTPRSESARHSRTEESLQEQQHYMEMNFEHVVDKSVRSRIPSPQTDSETPNKTCSSKKTPFLVGLFSRKSFSAGKSSVTSPTDGGTLPRSSRSMPPSPFSSLKRPSKSSKTRRTTTTTQSTSPVSPDHVDLSSALMFHQRGQSMRSHSMGHSRSSLHSPLTPPSPSAGDFVIQPQFSPPPQSTVKPGSSQPISIALHNRHTTPRGSPALMDEYVLPHTRYSTSPGRLMPTLSPLPEVLLNTMTTKDNNTGYMNMGPASNNELIGKFTFEELPGSGDTTPTSTPSSRNEASQPVRIQIIDDKENNIETEPVTSASAVTPTNQVSVIPAVAAKQRANSLEKIVCAFEKVIIGPKRHSSGDKPMKRSSGTLIHRSNSYQPSSASRVIIAGNKPASLFPLLTDIPAGKIMSSSKNSKSPPGQQLANVAGSRTSSSSLVSLGEDSAAIELQAVNWNSFTPLTNQGPSPSNSPSLLSRPTSAVQKEIHYAQLDLTAGQCRSTPTSDDFTTEEVPKSPRIPRPSSTSSVSDPPASTTTYAQIDFKKSEGLKTIGHL